MRSQHLVPCCVLVQPKDLKPADAEQRVSLDRARIWVWEEQESFAKRVLVLSD